MVTVNRNWDNKPDGWILSEIEMMLLGSQLSEYVGIIEKILIDLTERNDKLAELNEFHGLKTVVQNFKVAAGIDRFCDSHPYWKRKQVNIKGG